jgi:hypothetical protein
VTTLGNTMVGFGTKWSDRWLKEESDREGLLRDAFDSMDDDEYVSSNWG